MKRKAATKNPGGFIKVGEGHELYYETFGNPHGIKILSIHGGPGAGFQEHDKRFFDQKKFFVVFYDQRGAGRSTPFATLKANTTPELVADINTLLDHLKVNKISLFGGSWGSTLALTYAIQNRSRVNAMVLRGIFLGSSKSINQYLGKEIQRFFPETYERFMSLVPAKARKNPATFYLKQFRSRDPKKRELFSREWAHYELSISRMRVSEEKIESMLKTGIHRSLAPLEAHYLTNNCFLPANYILRHAHTLSRIPTSIVHGRYDFVCAPQDAYLLHKEIKGSRLHFTCAGHSGSEAETEAKLIEELGWLRRLKL